jgi:hypothetical protein
MLLIGVLGLFPLAAQGCAAAGDDAPVIDRTPWLVEQPTGEIELVALQPKQVINTTAWALQNRRYDLLLDQVVSDETKADYAAAGRDPVEAIEWMVANEAEIYKLFNLFTTQGMSRMDAIGGRRMRFRLYGTRATLLSITTMDVVREDRKWKLAVIR